MGSMAIPHRPQPLVRLEDRRHHMHAHGILASAEVTMENDSARPSGSSRLIALLDAVALAGGRLRYRDAARALAPISPNTVARLLRELVSARVLERNAGGSRLGDRPVFWAVSVPLERDLRHLARPVLTRLSGELGLTACMAAPMDGHVTIID